MDYQDNLLGDFDDFTLSFNTATSGTFAGTQKGGQNTVPLSGTFTSQ
jgi:hypothetical protein